MRNNLLHFEPVASSVANEILGYVSRTSMKTTKPVAISFAFLLATAALAPPALAQDIVVTELRIPTHSSGKKGLEAVMVRPNDAKPHPLALMTHGTPREAKDRADMTPLRFIPQAREFARRGWTTVIVMRRGFGDSGGGYAEDGHVCGRAPDFVGPTKQAVKDLRESAAYLRTRPEVDPSRMISVGASTGGLAMVGLSADPPPGLVAAISFAGGRGSDAPDHVCHAGDLVQAFGEFGKHSKAPMLWIYAANDHFFGPSLAHRFHREFTEKGGNARFIPAAILQRMGIRFFLCVEYPYGRPWWTIF